MRSRASSRNAARSKSPNSSSANSNTMPSITTTLAGSSSSKKSTKFPQITNSSSDDYLSPPLCLSPTNTGSGLIVGVCSQQGKRPYQEDEYHSRQFLNPVGTDGNVLDSKVETHFFGLFDGHAGGKCSKYISSCLSTTLAEDHQFITNLPQALKRSFHTANEQFLKIAEKMKLHDGSTGIVAIVRDTKVLVANVGDCRCLIISGGRAIQMSIDQKPTDPGEQKRIAALGGTVVYCMGVARVNRVLAVSRAFGNRTLRTVIRPDAEMMQRELTREDDFLVMASDGLWDVLKNKDVSDMCYSSYAQGNQQIIADELVALALQRGSMDNVTCQVVKLNDYVTRILNNASGGNLNQQAMTPAALNKAANATYPGIGGNALSRTGSFQQGGAPSQNQQQQAGFYTPNQNGNGVASDGGGHKRVLSNSASTPNGITMTAANQANSNQNQYSGLNKQYSLGMLPASNNGQGGGVNYNTGSYLDQQSGSDSELSPLQNNNNGNGVNHQIKRMATPNRMAPLTKTPSGNGLLSVDTLGSPKNIIKSPIGTISTEDLDGAADSFSPLNGSLDRTISGKILTPQQQMMAQRQAEMDEQFLFNNSTPSRKNSMMALKGTAVSQSFGGNTGSSKEMQADIASFSSKIQNAHGQAAGGHATMQRAASVGVNGGNILRVSVNTNALAAPGSQSPSISSMYGNGSPGGFNQTGHQGFAPKKIPSLGAAGSGDWSAAAAVAASNANSIGYDQQPSNGQMPPLFSSSPSTKRMLQTGAAH